jgi:hypothetical protein
MHLFGHTLDHDYYFELPSEGSGIPNHFSGDLLHTLAISGLSRVRTELFPLLVVPSLAPHPVQTNPVPLDERVRSLFALGLFFQVPFE